MIGIKTHTHEQRKVLVEKLIPLLKNKFGDNFVGLAADGSYARDEDTDYSDLELIVFLKDISPEVDWSIRKIVDGQLIVVVPETKESFIQKYLEVTRTWYASGAGKLLSIVNTQLIGEINDFKPRDLDKKCLAEVGKRWPEFQEIVAKLFNALKQNDRQGFVIEFPIVVKEILIILSFLNTTPYKTLGSYIPQAKLFENRPRGFEELTDIVLSDTQNDFQRLERCVRDIFSEWESMLIEKKSILYPTSIEEIVAS